MIRTSGSPVPALTESGALPTGVSFADLGTGMALLSGTPAPGTAGMYPLTITAVNGNGSPAMRTFVLMVEPLTVSGVAPATITAGASGVAITVTGTGFRPAPRSPPRTRGSRSPPSWSRARARSPPRGASPGRSGRPVRPDCHRARNQSDLRALLDRLGAGVVDAKSSNHDPTKAST